MAINSSMSYAFQHYHTVGVCIKMTLLIKLTIIQCRSNNITNIGYIQFTNKNCFFFKCCMCYSSLKTCTHQFRTVLSLNGCKSVVKNAIEQLSPRLYTQVK